MSNVEYFFRNCKEILAIAKFKNRFLYSNLCLGIGFFFDKGLAFFSKVLIARILLKEDLGIIVLIISIISLFECLSDVGIGQSIVQNENGESYEYLNIAWWFQSARGVVLFFLGILLTKPICHFYFDKNIEILMHYSWMDLYFMTGFSFFGILFNSFMSPGISVLKKRFNFGKFVIFSQGSSLIGTFMTIVLTLVLKSPWAMILGFMFQSLLRCILSFIFCPFRPSTSFDKKSFIDILTWSKGIFGSSLLTYLSYTLDVLIGAKLVPIGTVGMYGFSASLAKVPRDLYSGVISPVLYSTLSCVKNDNCKLNLLISTSVNLLFQVSFPWLAIGVIFGEPILVTIYGDNFRVVVFPFVLYLFVSFLRIMNSSYTNGLYSQAQTALDRRALFVRFIIISAFIFPVIKFYGINYAPFVLIAGEVSSICMRSFYLKSLTGFKHIGSLENYIAVFLFALVLFSGLFLLNGYFLAILILPILLFNIYVFIKFFKKNKR